MLVRTGDRLENGDEEGNILESNILRSTGHDLHLLGGSDVDFPNVEAGDKRQARLLSILCNCFAINILLFIPVKASSIRSNRIDSFFS